MSQSIPKEISPVFIVSSGRSGTTLLRGMLNASNQIYIPHESEFIARAYPFYQDNQSFDEHDYQQIIKLFAKTSQDNGWGMSRDYLLCSLKERVPQTFADVNSTIYRAYLKQKGLEDLQWGIKAPVLIASLQEIFKVFPEAKVIHIVRDGRDVALSYESVHRISKKNFGPKGTIMTALYWVDGLRRVEELHDARIYELRYEDLLNCAEIELERLCTFLGMKYDQSMHESYQHSDANKDLILEQHKQNIHSKVGKWPRFDKHEKYLNNMPKLDRFVFELIAIPYLVKYRYSLEFKFLNSPFLNPLRDFLYLSARQFNDWRYRRRATRVFP